jgi:hypothetical protein
MEKPPYVLGFFEARFKIRPQPTDTTYPTVAYKKPVFPHRLKHGDLPKGKNEKR